MNKKQMVILWILGIWVSLVIMDAGGKIFFFHEYSRSIPLKILGSIVPPLIIGSLLIYSLRTRKK